MRTCGAFPSSKNGYGSKLVVPCILTSYLRLVSAVDYRYWPILVTPLSPQHDLEVEMGIPISSSKSFFCPLYYTRIEIHSDLGIPHFEKHPAGPLSTGRQLLRCGQLQSPQNMGGLWFMTGWWLSPTALPLWKIMDFVSWHSMTFPSEWEPWDPWNLGNVTTYNNDHWLVGQ